MLRTPLHLLVAAAAASPWAFAGSEVERLPVLMYHHLVTGEPESAAELHVDCFRNQLEFLHDHGFTALTLAEFQRHHETGTYPERSLLITFDDGYRSFLEHAHPVLLEYGFSSVVFPVVGLRPGLQRTVVWADHLSFHELRLMMTEGGLIDLGSHTFDLHHQCEAERAIVLRQPDEGAAEHRDRVHDDLLASKLLLELQTDRAITALAWPYGVFTSELVDLAAGLGFVMQFTIAPGYVTAETSLTALPRFNVAAAVEPCFREVLEQTLE